MTVDEPEDIDAEQEEGNKQKEEKEDETMDIKIAIVILRALAKCLQLFFLGKQVVTDPYLSKNDTFSILKRQQRLG